MVAYYWKSNRVLLELPVHRDIYPHPSEGEIVWIGLWKSHGLLMMGLSDGGVLWVFERFSTLR
jgi:hypothetical protein